MTAQCITSDYNSIASVSPQPAKVWGQMPKLVQWWLARRRCKVDRVALKELSSLDDVMLKDIGVSRGDVMWASKLPSSVNASVELEIIARRRSGRHDVAGR